MSTQITFNELPNAVQKLFDKLSSIELILQNLEVLKLPDEDQLLTIKQAAELISLSVPTIYGLVQRSEIPVSKRGKRLYFSKQELTFWIREGRKKTVSELRIESEQYLNLKKGGLKR